MRTQSARRPLWAALFAFLAWAGAISLLAQQKVVINGAGATFPAPIYTKWFSEYNKLHPDIQINYGGGGSGQGVTQLTQQVVFFGGSDGPMSNQQLAAAPGKILHFPTVLGGVVPIYNVPGVTTQLKFSGQVLADMTLGRITKWNDAAIAKINPGVTLPNLDVTVIYRSESSGTTFIWSDFLSQASSEFRDKVGAATAVKWPVGVGTKGTAAVTEMVKQTPGAFGHVELGYALNNKVDYGAVQNREGVFLSASLETVTAAASAAAATMPGDFRVTIVNKPGKNAYPIASFTWLLVYEDPADKTQARAMVDFLKWALTDGQKYCADLGYAPLPADVVKLELAQLSRIKLQ
jgi:phosphate transport system substrate-binding protein